MSEAELLAALAAITKAIASGVQRVRFNDRDVEYRSLDEMLRAKAELEEELGKLQGKSRTRLMRVATSKGLRATA